MSNPYQAPSATVRDFADTGADQPYEPRLFSAQGRIGRLRYIAYSFGAQMIALVLAGLGAGLLFPVIRNLDASPALAGSLMFLCYAPVLLTLLVMARRRLNDLDQSGWLALLMLLPLINILLSLVLLFWPGSKGANRFGPPPARNGVLVVLFALVVPLATIGVLAAVAIPAYQQYVVRAHAAAAPLPEGLPARP